MSLDLFYFDKIGQQFQDCHHISIIPIKPSKSSDHSFWLKIMCSGRTNPRSFVAMTRHRISVLIWVFLTISPCQLQIGLCGTALTSSLKHVLPYRQVQWCPYKGSPYNWIVYVLIRIVDQVWILVIQACERKKTHCSRKNSWAPGMLTEAVTGKGDFYLAHFLYKDKGIRHLRYTGINTRSFSTSSSLAENLTALEWSRWNTLILGGKYLIG